MKKNIVKIAIGLGLVAILLIFLGVNYVPRTSALTVNKAGTSNIPSIDRSDYRNEYFQRSIIRISKYSGSDWIERHPVANSLSLRYVGSDLIERHPISSDQLLRYSGSGVIVRHPIYYYDNSDYFERHP